MSTSSSPERILPPHEKVRRQRSETDDENSNTLKNEEAKIKNNNTNNQNQNEQQQPQQMLMMMPQQPHNTAGAAAKKNNHEVQEIINIDDESSSDDNDNDDDDDGNKAMMLLHKKTRKGDIDAASAAVIAALLKEDKEAGDDDTSSDDSSVECESRNDDDEVPKRGRGRGRGARGGRGRGGRAAVANGRGRGRGRAAKKKGDETTSDEEIEGSFASSSDSDDTDASDDSSSSSGVDDDNDTDSTAAVRRGRGRGRGRGRPAGAAAAGGVRGRGRGRPRGGGANVDQDAANTQQKKKNNNSNGDGTSASSSDSDSDSSSHDNDDDDAAAAARPRERLLRPRGQDDQLLRDFRKRIEIPFFYNRGDPVPARPELELDRPIDERFQLLRTDNIMQIIRVVHDSLFVTVKRNDETKTLYKCSDPIGPFEPFTRRNAASDLSIHNFIPYVVGAESCGCLYSASNYSKAQDRRLLFQAAVKTHRTVRLIAPANDQPPAGTKRARWLDATTREYREGFCYEPRAWGQDRHDAYGFIDEYSFSDHYKWGLVMVAPNCRLWISFDWTDVVDSVQARVRAEELIQSSPLANASWKGYGHYGIRDEVLVVHKKENYLETGSEEERRRHALHHLFVRLRGLECAGGANLFSEFVAANLQVLGDTRARVWRHRFIIENLVKCGFKFDGGRRTLKNEMPTFDNLLHEIMTPSALFEVAKEMQSKSAKEIFEFFGNDLVRVRQDVRGVPVRPPGITVDLFPHQRRTVAFMIDREKNGVDSFVHSDPIPLPGDTSIRERGLAVPLEKYTHYRYHVNSALGAFAVTPVGSDADVEIMSGGKHRGGMLADEVGMGKTLSVLSLISLNKPAYETQIIDNADNPIYSCVPSSDFSYEERLSFKRNLKTKLKIKATLVLAPVSLVGQWEDEIRTRSPNLKVLRYHGSEKKKSITYADFAAADVVITTFETYRLTLRDEAFWFKWFGAMNDVDIDRLLMNEVKANPSGLNRRENFFVRLPEFKTLKAQFKVLGKTVTRDGVRPSAETVFLSRLHFHRIVLDEFHKQGALADAPVIDSDYLWLVSGTPLDAPIGRFLKRLGVMDFSFVKNDELRFISETSEAPFDVYNDPVAVSSFVPTPTVESVLFDEEIPKFRNYTPPAQFACNYARLAFLSQYMIRNTVDTCPELANVRVTEKIVTVKHTEKEKEKYNDTLEKVRTELNGLRARGALQTRILYVMTLLNNLRRAAVDPFGVTINVRDALAVGGGAQFENENQRRNIHLVPVNIFAHLLFPRDFPLNIKKSGGGADGAGAADKAYSHVKSVAAIGTLKDGLEGMLKQPPELESCIICLENLAQPTVISCGHIFCRECILQWIQRGGAANCPGCRRESLGDTKKKSLLTFPPPPQEEEDNNNLLVKKEEPGGENVLKNKKEEDDSKIPTKIKKVMEIVRDSIAEDHTSKFLIFTAFPSVLKFLSDELARASIGSVIIDGSSTLTQRAERIKLFQNLGSFNVRVCIVSSRVGNMGLTLTAANHLIIIDPASNIDVDTQILGRVKRLGQKRAVTCHRLHVEDSIEVPLHQLVQSRTVSLSAGGSEASKKQVTDTVLKLVYPTGVPDVDNAAIAAAAAAAANQNNDDDHNNRNEMMLMNNNNNNNNEDDPYAAMNQYEREQMEQVARWEREQRLLREAQEKYDENNNENENQQQQLQQDDAAGNNNNNNLLNDHFTAEERRQMEEIARWERENGVN